MKMDRTRPETAPIKKLLYLLLLLSASTFAGPLPIWEVNTADNRFVMMGSIHYLRPTDYPLPATFYTVLEDADLVLMELDTGNLDSLQTMMLMETVGRDSSGRTLKDLIGADDYNDVSSRATALGIPMMMLNDKEPWYAAMLVSQVRLMQLGFDSAWGIETQFTAAAGQAGKPINGLETIEQQLSALDNLPFEVQLEFLQQSLGDEAAADMNDMLEAWKSGDTSAMEQSLLIGMDGMPELYESIVVNRNRNWVRQLEQLDFENSGKTFLVIVGSMHLVGDDSVQELFGYEYGQLVD